MDNLYDKIINAADELFAEQGKRPTLVEVRNRVGGGSMTTISEAMKVWRQRMDERPAHPGAVSVPEQIEQEMAKFMVALWQTASTVANDRLAKEREALEQARSEFETQLAEADDVIAMLEKEKKESLAQVKTLTAKLEKVKKQLRIDHDQCLLAKSNNSQLEQTLKEERVANKELRKELAAVGKNLTVAESENKLLKEQIKELNKLLSTKLAGAK